VESVGAGVVHAATTIHHAAHRAAEPWVPYTVLLVDLDEGVRIVSRLPLGLPEPALGTAVEVVFLDYAELTLPAFVPVR
jgi:uncharacterized OB-fold protein